MIIDTAFLAGQEYQLGNSLLIYLRRVKAKVPMWLFQYPTGPLETFTKWQLEDALTPDRRGLSKANKAVKPHKDNPFKKTFGKGQPLVTKKGGGK